MTDSTTNRTETDDLDLVELRRQVHNVVSEDPVARAMRMGNAVEAHREAWRFLTYLPRLVDEIERLDVVINGCACPPPYDACTHDEPLTKTIERLRADNAALHASITAAEDHLSALLNEREELRKELGY